MRRAKENPKMTYRLDLPILALAPLKDGHQDAVTIPVGQIVEVIGPAEDEHFLIVSADGQEFHIFASDLSSRAKQVKSVGA